uniref:Uncharacterized protein n=1 Tax=Sarcophilus harrisii TaxID=9305 RepID=A0A7N4PQQ5_SARHA
YFDIWGKGTSVTVSS